MDSATRRRAAPPLCRVAAVRDAPEISGAVEGEVDEAVFMRLVLSAGGAPRPPYGKQGRETLLSHLHGYNLAAARTPWLVMVDLDDDDCAPELIARYLPAPSPLMAFRVAVREVEAWLLADAECLGAFLGVSPARIPRDPDSVAEPKDVMVHLAAGSRRRDIRADMVPRPKSGRRVGPAYNSRLVEFVIDGITGWSIENASARSDSLRRATASVTRVVQGAPMAAG